MYLKNALLNVLFSHFRSHIYMTATSERAFSTLRCVLTYFHSSMTEQRLNHCITLHTHKHLTDSIYLAEIGNEFISSNSEKKHYFGLYKDV